VAYVDEELRASSSLHSFIFARKAYILARASADRTNLTSVASGRTYRPDTFHWRQNIKSTLVSACSRREGVVRTRAIVVVYSCVRWYCLLFGDIHVAEGTSRSDAISSKSWRIDVVCGPGRRWRSIFKTKISGGPATAWGSDKSHRSRALRVGKVPRNSRSWKARHERINIKLLKRDDSPTFHRKEHLLRTRSSKHCIIVREAKGSTNATYSNVRVVLGAHWQCHQSDLVPAGTLLTCTEESWADPSYSS